MQEMGAEHSQQFGVSGPQLMQSHGVVWVVNRSKLIIHRYPSQEEEISVSTWIREPKGFTIPRDVEGRDGSGNILFEGCTFWVPVDMKTLRPQRAVQFTGGVIPNRETPLLFAPEKVAPLTEPRYTLDLPIMVRDIDGNCHVNNGVYIDWLVEAMVSVYGRTIDLAEVTMNYLQEIPLEAKGVRIQTQPLGNTGFLHSFVHPETGVEYARSKTFWEGLY